MEIRQYAGYASEASFVRNLEDTGCDEDTVKHLLQLTRDGKTQELLRQLTLQRRKLLEDLHRSGKRIDCLDYLVYQIQKNNDI